MQYLLFYYHKTKINYIECIRSFTITLRGELHASASPPHYPLSRSTSTIRCWRLLSWFLQDQHLWCVSRLWPCQRSPTLHIWLDDVRLWSPACTSYSIFQFTEYSYHPTTDLLPLIWTPQLVYPLPTSISLLTIHNTATTLPSIPKIWPKLLVRP